VKLKQLLTALALCVLLLPFAIAFVVSSFRRDSVSEEAVNRFILTAVEIEKAMELSDSGLIARPGYSAPAWLEFSVFDASGRAVASFPGGERGSAGLASGPGTALGRAVPGEAAEEAVPRRVMYAERLLIGKRDVGSYRAFVFPVEITPRERSRDSPWLWVTFLAIFAICILGSFAVSAHLARAVTRLEEAAGRIASGDLDSRVSVRGVLEIRSLAAAMDRMRERLKEDQSRRSRFLAAVSHDLRTPLTSIRGYLEAIEDGLAVDPEGLARYLATAKDKSRVLEGRVDELIEFARMETGEWRLRFEELDLGAFLERLASEYSQDALAAGRRFEADISIPRELGVKADARLLARALENLFSNALRYAPEGSGIRFSASRTGKGTVLIALEDEGPGIPVDELERIFEPWFRGSAAVGCEEGLGLGLYIAASIARGHGFGIAAVSPAGGGGRFELTIPARAIPRQHPA